MAVQTFHDIPLTLWKQKKAWKRKNIALYFDLSLIHI